MGNGLIEQVSDIIGVSTTAEATLVQDDLVTGEPTPPVIESFIPVASLIPWTSSQFPVRRRAPSSRL